MTSSVQKILDIVQNPNSKIDYVLVIGDVNVGGNMNIDVNLNDIAVCRNMDLKKMNIIVAYIGSTISISGDLNISVSNKQNPTSSPNCDVLYKSSSLTAKILTNLKNLLNNQNDPLNDVLIMDNVNVEGNADLNYNFQKIANNKSDKSKNISGRNYLFAYIGSNSNIRENLNINISSGSNIDANSDNIDSTSSQYPTCPTPICPTSICPTCPTCPVCQACQTCDYSKYIAGIGILSVLLLITFIVLMVYMMK